VVSSCLENLQLHRKKNATVFNAVLKVMLTNCQPLAMDALDHTCLHEGGCKVCNVGLEML
jgi:hypothetical protein